MEDAIVVVVDPIQLRRRGGGGGGTCFVVEVGPWKHFGVGVLLVPVRLFIVARDVNWYLSLWFVP